jgi:hypothetical protein
VPRLGPTRAPALISALVVLIIGGVALTAAHHARRPPVAPRLAVRDALRDPRARAQLAGVRWDRAVASDVDGSLERVSLFDGPRIVAEFAVGRDGAVRDGINFTKLRVPYGDWIAYQPLVLGGLAVVFLLMAAVAPLRRMRNLDAVAALSLTAPLVLLEHRYLGASVLAAAPGTVYLACRCAWVALRPAARTKPQPATALFVALTRGWGTRRRAFVLRWLLAGLGVTFVLVGVSSADAVDVIYAVMEGATKLIHGILPYGHLPGDVVHGDTYPILSYGLYAPLAWLSPVGSVWDSVDLALGATVLAALGLAALAHRLARMPATVARGAQPPDDQAGLRAALLVLSFPPLLATVSTGTTDVTLALMLSSAVLLWRRPGRSTAILAAAGWFKLAPFALVPIWLAPLRGRRLAAALVGAAAVSLAVLSLVLALGGADGVSAMWRAVSYQLSRGSPQSIWSVLHLAALQPWCQALTLAVVAGTAVRVGLRPALAEDRARIAAAAAAVLLALQLSADYWAFLYTCWAIPLLALALLAPAGGAGEPADQRAAAVHGLQAAPA